MDIQIIKLSLEHSTCYGYQDDYADDIIRIVDDRSQFAYNSVSDEEYEEIKKKVDRYNRCSVELGKMDRLYLIEKIEPKTLDQFFIENDLEGPYQKLLNQRAKTQREYEERKRKDEEKKLARKVIRDKNKLEKLTVQIAKLKEKELVTV